MHKSFKEAPPSMLVNELSKLFNDRMRQKTEALGMADGWRRMFFHLSHNESLTQQELVRKTHLSAPAVSVTLQKMEAEGLVSRQSVPEDQRTTQVRLTPAGHAANRKVISAIHDTEREMLKGVTPEEIAAIRPVLEKMYQNLAAKGLHSYE